MADGYISHVAPACSLAGTGRCQFTEAMNILTGAQELTALLTGRNQMSQALWCDSGGHAFSERDPGRQRIAITVLDEETGEERMESRDFCGECAAKAGLLAKRRTRPAAIPAKADPVRIRDLEEELGMPHNAT